jgi:hypothetical protein
VRTCLPRKLSDLVLTSFLALLIFDHCGKYVRQLRFVFQPILILYYWPVFLFRNLIGLTPDYKKEARNQHNQVVAAWNEAVETAQDQLFQGEFTEFVDQESLDNTNSTILAGLDVSGQDLQEKMRADVIIEAEQLVQDTKEEDDNNTEQIEDKILAPKSGVSVSTVNVLAEEVQPEINVKVVPVETPEADAKRDYVEPLPQGSNIVGDNHAGAEMVERTVWSTLSAASDAPRWAVAAEGVDLTGKWLLQDKDNFKQEYDEYLKALGQPSIVRAVALTLIGLTREELIQEDDGRILTINGINPRGIWNRQLVSSGWYPTGSTSDNNDFDPVFSTIQTADGEDVEAEAWWEEEGTVHKSWLRGGLKYGGGDFESSRYLSEDGNKLICTSIFYPRDPNMKKTAEKNEKLTQVTWRFRREAT